MLAQGAPPGTKDTMDNVASKKKKSSTTYQNLDPSAYTPATYAYLTNQGGSSDTGPDILNGGGLDEFYNNQRNRIPRGNELEGMSSDTIADLLNPPDFFPEVDRRSAELASGRGIAGSPAGFGAGVKMTDDEKLKRIALGQGFLSAAAGRNPAIDPSFLYQTPQQKAQLELDKQRLDLQKKAMELENELTRLKIRNLSTVSVSGFSGGGIFRSANSPSAYNPAFTEDKMAAADASFGASIGGWGGTGGSGLPQGYDPNFDFTG